MTKTLRSQGFCRYKNVMEIEFDPAKEETNQQKHGVSLVAAELMVLAEATVALDTRASYGEDRYRAWGFIGGVLHVMAFTMRGEVVRVISLRKANTMENRRYGKT